MDNPHLSTLEQKHTMLEEKIIDEEKRPSPDFMTLNRLKKEKLLIKEEIESLLIT